VLIPSPRGGPAPLFKANSGLAASGQIAAAAKLCAELGHRVDEARPEWDEKARAAASRVIRKPRDLV
jgi:hypothetical protein